MTPEEDRVTAIGNMQQKFGKDHTCGSGDILVDRQTDRHTQTHSSQYFAAAPVGKVKNDTLFTCWQTIYRIHQHTGI